MSPERNRKSQREEKPKPSQGIGEVFLIDLVDFLNNVDENRVDVIVGMTTSQTWKAASAALFPLYFVLSSWNSFILS
jgi:hypothetical protein